jgi:hypothetical protein
VLQPLIFVPCRIPAHGIIILIIGWVFTVIEGPQRLNAHLYLRKQIKMSLSQQFPDISGRIRAKAKRVTKPVNANRPLLYSEDSGVAAYYEGEFRRWHAKLFFIVSACIAIIYLAFLNSARIIH